MEEAKKLVRPSGFQWVKNHVTTGNFDRALAVLTSKEKVSLNFSDSSRAVLQKNSKAATWREELMKQGTTREFSLTFQEVLLAMADNRDQAQKILTEIESKFESIDGKLDEIDKDAADAKARAEKLQASGPDGLFVAKSITGNVLPVVLGEDGKPGMIAQGRALARRDFIQAWDKYAEPSERLIGDVNKVLGAGEEARRSVLPTLTEADNTLRSHGVKTEWAFAEAKELSDRLEQIANTAVRTSVDKDLQALTPDLRKFGEHVTTVVKHDARHQESLGTVGKADAEIAKARQEITAALQQAGAFKAGTPEGALREPTRDPSTRIADANHALDAVRGRLSVGDTSVTDTQLQRVDGQTREALSLVSQTREGLKAYAPTLKERQERTLAAEKSIDAKYTPSLSNIQKTFDAAVQRLVAAEAGAGNTVADNIDEARKLLVEAHEITDRGIGNFDKARILTAMSDLGEADGVLKAAQAQLDGVTAAERLLAEKQTACEKELAAMDQRFVATRQHVKQSFVREKSPELLTQAEPKLEVAHRAVGKAPRNPFEARTALEAAEAARRAVEAAVDYDRQQIETAKSSIASADSAIKRAGERITHASQQSWRYSSSAGEVTDKVTSEDLAAAHAALVPAGLSVEAARKQLDQKEYENSTKSATDSKTAADSAFRGADAAIATANGRFEKAKACVQAME